MFDWGAVGEKSVIGVVTAIVLAALAGLWNWASGGGVVRFFGGMTRTELASFQTVPAGAVISIPNYASKSGSCLRRWQSRTAAQGIDMSTQAGFGTAH
jgi:hypothetical protein